MGLLDKLKGLTKGRERQIAQAVDKAGAAINKKTGGRYGKQIDAAEHKVDDVLGTQAGPTTGTGTEAGPAAGTGTGTQAGPTTGTGTEAGPAAGTGTQAGPTTGTGTEAGPTAGTGTGTDAGPAAGPPAPPRAGG